MEVSERVARTLRGRLCWLLGHRWLRFDTIELSPDEKDRWVWLNKRCVHCGEPLNPITYARQTGGR